MHRWASAAVAALAALAPSVATAVETQAPQQTSYQGGTLCQITDRRATAISGLATIDDATLLVNDSWPAVVYAVGRGCRVTEWARPGIRVTDVEDLATTVDGSLWLADTGGNRRPRAAVTVWRLPARDAKPVPYQLTYPDGPQDTEALLVGLDGALVLVSKAADGRSGVYTTGPSPVAGSVTRLVRAGTLDLTRLPFGALTPNTRLVTGGAVSPDGTRLVLRTYRAAYEWDAPDCDLVSAILRTQPRAFELPRSRQGEAITYGPDSSVLYASSEQLPAPLHQVRVVRPGGSPSQGSAVPPAYPAAAAALVFLALTGWGVWARTRGQAGSVVVTTPRVLLSPAGPPPEDTR